MRGGTLGLEMRKGAKFSEDRAYRYSLYRIWNAMKESLAVIGLNPSRADESENDNTVTRCIGFAQRWGLGGLWMLNAFAFKATDPSVMKKAKDPIGPDNDAEILARCKAAKVILVAWGCDGGYLDRDLQIMDLLRKHKDRVFSLGETKDGFPKHPLYLANNTVLVPYSGRKPCTKES